MNILHLYYINSESDYPICNILNLFIYFQVILFFTSVFIILKCTYISLIFFQVSKVSNFAEDVF